MDRALFASILLAAIMLAGCDDSKKSSSKAESQASAPAEASAAAVAASQSAPEEAFSSAPAETASSAGSFQILADNRATIEKYTAQKADAETILAEIQAAVAANPSALGSFRRDASSPRIEEQTQKLQALSDQAIQKFSVGIMSLPLGECGALGDAAGVLGDAAFEYWHELLNARTEGRNADPWYKAIYTEGVDACRDEIKNPPPPEVTVKLAVGAAPPVEGCRKVPEFSSTGDAINSGKMVCPAEAIKALK